MSTIQSKPNVMAQEIKILIARIRSTPSSIITEAYANGRKATINGVYKNAEKPVLVGTNFVAEA